MAKSKQVPIEVDHLHPKLWDAMDNTVKEVWNKQYRKGKEEDIDDTFYRVVGAVYKNDNSKHLQDAYTAMRQGLFCPGGRILAGAGTGNKVTLMNCFVNGTIHDSMQGIMDGLKSTASTLQQGGGMGNDYSTIRPRGAKLVRTGEGAQASGPVSFMRITNTTSATVKSAGARRGANMSTLICTHPDIMEFIKCKQVQGELTETNISVLVTDEFMRAVKDDLPWNTYFSVAPLKERTDDLVAMDFTDNKGVKQYIYSTYLARDIWEELMNSTYEFSEPGVIFIDRYNELNNLQYCETISCTNPCGEQGLPPNGCCNLGAINLARIVSSPFSMRADINWDLLKRVTQIGIRFLDNVIDVTGYPLPEQEKEEIDKRRLGLGITGLADCLSQLKIKYGDPRGDEMAEKIMQFIAIEAYATSALLAKERGTFPLYDKKMLERPFVKKVCDASPTTGSLIAQFGLRNGVILTIAPTGTTSLILGNISSGLEPVFLHEMKRTIIGNDNQKHDHIMQSYILKLYRKYNNGNMPEVIPNHMPTMEDLKPMDHLDIQSALQRWVDSSVSKTINLPKDIPYDDFVSIYMHAYESGCKGCTTYRPSDIRGSVLSAPDTKETKEVATFNITIEEPILPKRPSMLNGATYKIKWPRLKSSIYLTINNDENGNPFEIFIQSKDARHQQWITALTVFMSALLRRGDKVEFITKELQQVQSMDDTAWIDGKFYNSLVSYIGHVIENHCKPESTLVEADTDNTPKGETCPECGCETLVASEGCKSCICGYSHCGG